MGIRCEIIIFKPCEGCFKPGSKISGLVEYTLQTETAFNKITVSLKGNGYLMVKNKKRDSNLYTYRKTEDYADIDYVIHRNENGAKLPAGTYQTEFNFILPQKIPPTFKYFKKNTRHLIKCQISYYIQLKFQRSGLLKPEKILTKTFNVIPLVSPSFHTEATVYGETKVFHKFNKKYLVDIKAIVENSVTTPGERVKIEYDVKNGTNVRMRGVEVKIVELYTFKNKGTDEVEILKDVKDTNSKTGSIRAGDNRNVYIEIRIPKLNTIQYSTLVSRSYFAVIRVIVPKYSDVFLKIPILIGDEVYSEKPEPLPSYWEVLEADDLENRRPSVETGSEDEDAEYHY